MTFSHAAGDANLTWQPTEFTTLPGVDKIILQTIILQKKKME